MRRSGWPRPSGCPGGRSTPWRAPSCSPCPRCSWGPPCPSPPRPPAAAQATSTALVPCNCFVNTVGAAAGALAASLVLHPWSDSGPRWSPPWSATPWLGSPRSPCGAAQWTPAPKTPLRAAGRCPGKRASASCCSALSYEMLLFGASLSHWPLPATFALGLAGFLVAWSLGVLAGQLQRTPAWSPS